jgi:hypothetical protein
MKITLPKYKGNEWIDFSSLSNFMTCPRKYFWRSILNIDDAGQNIALMNGSAYHEALSIYHNAIITGFGHEKAFAMAIYTLQTEMSKIIEPDKKRNATVATDTLSFYLEKYRDSPYKLIHAELTGAIDMGEFLYVGKLDGNIETPYGEGILETKTTSVVGDRWQSRGKPNKQIEGYMFLASVIFDRLIRVGVLDVIPIHEDPKKRKDPFRITTMRTEEELNAWSRDTLEWWHKIQDCTNRNYFPMHTERCIPLVGFSCPYTILCNKYADPFVYDESTELEFPDQFIVREWNPLKDEDEKNNNIIIKESVR